MMKSLLHLDDRERTGARAPQSNYESTVMVHSKAIPGVTFTISRISFGRRMELCRRVRDIGQKLEFLEAGDHFHEKVEANLLSHEIDKIYLEWGLVSVEGLLIDGEPATADLVLSTGPEVLTREIVEAIKSQCGLSEEERKN
jgi:hypothetical protein